MDVRLNGFFVPYQQRYLADRSSQKVVNKSRRIGFTEVVCFERACRAAGVAMWPGQPVRLVRPAPQNIVSAGLEQAKDVLRRIVKWLKFLEVVHKGPIIHKAGTTVVELKNGMHLRAYSGNPKSLRSFEGDLFLDEFSALRYQDAMWAAAAPLARANLGNPEGYQIVAVGTPLGDDNRFYEMVKGRYAKAFKLHEVDVWQAVADGFPIKVKSADGEWVDGTIDDLKAETADDDIFMQEYGCSFMSSSTRYISTDIYNNACYNDEDNDDRSYADADTLPDDFHAIGKTTEYAGIDIARRRDRTALTVVSRYGDVNWHRSTEVLNHSKIVGTDGKRGVPFEDQEAWVDRQITGCQRVAVDKSGMGEMFAERMESAWPGRIESFDFTQKSKDVFASGLKLALQRKKLRPKASDSELRREVLSMRREITELGNVRYLSPREGGGHGDRAWSLALAEYASGGAAKPTTAGRGYTHIRPPEAGPIARPQRGGWR